MPIKNRELEAGTRLSASYKKQNYFCNVEEDGERTAYVLEDGRRFSSPSAAGSALMGGKAVNGWRFWSLAEGHSPATPTPSRTEQRRSRGRANSTPGRGMIYRLPNQAGVEASMARHYCNGCQKSFVVSADVTPAACPAGHFTSEAAALASSVVEA